MQSVSLKKSRSAPCLWVPCLVILGINLISLVSGASAGMPDSSCILVELSHAEKPVTHSVMLRDSSTKFLRKRMLSGPRALVMTADKDNCLCLYTFVKIGSMKEQAMKESEDMIIKFKDSPKKVLLSASPPVATLLPGQLLRQGSPKAAPVEVVYELRHVRQTTGEMEEKIWAICQPVEYRHHFERIVPPENVDPFVIMETRNPANGSETLGVVDDLGIHRGQLGSTCRQVKSVELVQDN